MTAPIVRRDVWLIAGTALGQPYPCRCHERGGRDCRADVDPRWRCPCHGRTDLVGLTPTCCGVRAFLGTLQR